MNLARPDSKFRFGDQYREKAVLRDGTRVLVRPVRPSDAGLLTSGFERLSSESRYRRFFGYKKSLSADEVKYFTNVDGINHFAIGALVSGPDGKERGVAVGRFVRLSSPPTDADAAVTVVDAMQHKGLGRLLIERLLSAAGERGFKNLRFSVLASNRPMIAMLRKLKTGSTRSVDPQMGGGVVQFSLRVPSPAPASSTR
jgi:GNAT superfamily N-acetyltransferase